MKKYYYTFVGFLFLLANNLFAQDNARAADVVEGGRGGTTRNPEIGGFDVYAILIGIVIGLIIGYLIFNKMKKSK